MTICSDVDEIPRASAIAAYKPSDGIRSLGMAMYRFYFNVRAGDADCIEWTRPKILPVSEARCNECRAVRDSWRYPIIHNAGWHFTSCGGAEAVRYKLDSFAHAQMPHNPILVEGLRDGTWVDGCGVNIGLKSNNAGLHSVVEIDETWPKFVQENIPLMKSWGMLYE